MIDWLTDFAPFAELMEQLYSGQKVKSLGLMRPARLPLEAALHAKLDVPVLILTDRTDHALTLQDEMKFWAGDVPRYLFPEPNPLFYEQAAWGNATRRDRLQALTALAAYHIPGAQKPQHPPLVIAPIRAIMARTLPRRDFIKASRVVKLGQQFKLDQLLQTWVEIGYNPADLVLEVGQFSRRGGILDIWPAGEGYPIRLEFFGDELETLRAFDPASQRTLRSLSQVLITPAREVLPGKAASVGIELKDVDEFQLPVVHPAVSSLLDYLPANSLVVVDDFDLIRVMANDIEEQAVKLRQESIREGTLAGDFPVPYLTFSEFTDSLGGHYWLDLGRSEEEEEISELSGSFEPGQRFGGRLKPFMDHLIEMGEHGDRLVVVSRQASRLRELWGELPTGRTARLMNRPDFLEGTLSGGFIFHMDDRKRLGFFTDSEIFGWERPRPRQAHRPVAEAPENNYADLRPGDWVVHIDYGVGRYLGLVRRTLEGSEREFLCIEYDNGDQLFVPVHQADRLSRYVGPEGETPSPTRLGTAEWSQAKQKVREAVQQVAQEMLELYARRQVAVGYSFKPDTPWQQELEASFPYVETPDQLRAITEVKRDMEASRPMDRLLCGDVGYGKTEVALRAAFKAVMDGKQVAVLCPTTVLASQHLKTFRARMALFPVRVEALTRLQSPREQKAVLEECRKGFVDILVGTHRLLSKDVGFKDLGLLVVDEEQRFGVGHKERIKQLKATIDVLTLTATPIPRTLNLSLSGLRDISLIETPPRDRLAVHTVVTPFNAKLVAAAVRQELGRGGQVYYIHNRIEDIDKVAELVVKLVPQARVVAVHGRMTGPQLEKRMLDFVDRKYDVLVSTTIVENGIDIPLVNTLIVDRADLYGLAQLYQLRGRVGRSSRQAYAYFLVPPYLELTPLARERLKALKEFSELGSGFRLAARDLEIRGAGNLLGHRQHGTMESVGFEYYMQLLDQAIRGLKGEPVEEDNPEINLRVDIRVPEDYLPQVNLRLNFYKRLASVEDLAEIDRLRDEARDRFGPVPEPVENLLRYGALKHLAKKLRLRSVDRTEHRVVFKFRPETPVDWSRVTPLLKRYSGSLTPEGVLSLAFRGTTERALLDETVGVLLELSK